jgi:hypothetical protein
MRLKAMPHTPTWHELQQKARSFPPKDLHDHWIGYIYPEQADWGI